MGGESGYETGTGSRIVSDSPLPVPHRLSITHYPLPLFQNYAALSTPISPAPSFFATQISSHAVRRAQPVQSRATFSG